MAEEFKFPNKRAAIYWPVGTGDSTTLILRPDEYVMQIDLRHMEKAEDPDEPEWPIINHLVRLLPKKNKRPYLAAFALTHPDKDHVQGFKELLSKVDIGELWHTPKIFREQKDDESLCDDAKAFRKEANRRREVMISKKGKVDSGDRLRVIGFDDLLKEDKYKHFPKDALSIPGHTVAVVDGTDLTGEFEAFIHAPFKDDQAKDKNNTSLSLNVSLRKNTKEGRFFFFGDRQYVTIKRIFEESEKAGNTAYLNWNVLLSAHHCSKSVMYWEDEPGKEKKFRKDIMDYFEKYNIDGDGYIISSSHTTFTDGDGDNPPHAKARRKYEGIVSSGHFLCTHEIPNRKKPRPLVFTVDDDGPSYNDERSSTGKPGGLASAVVAARGSTKPPSVQVGFGRK